MCFIVFPNNFITYIEVILCLYNTIIKRRTFNFKERLTGNNYLVRNVKTWWWQSSLSTVFDLPKSQKIGSVLTD